MLDVLRLDCDWSLEAVEDFITSGRYRKQAYSKVGESQQVTSEKTLPRNLPKLYWRVAS